MALAVVLVAGCSSAPPRGSRRATANPAGYRVHVLTGDSLGAADVAINGLAIDVSSVATIEASVQAILVGDRAPPTVVETTGVAPDLAVDFTGAATPVPPLFHGANLGWSSKFFITNPRWRALVRHMKLSILRFPGGQERVRYDGKESVAGTPVTDTLKVTSDQPYEYRLSGEDVANYIALCRELGIAAEPEVNLTNDDPTMWADLVRQIVNDLGYDLQYLSIGNEPDNDSANGNWPYLGATGATVRERRGNALAHYVQRYRAYRQAIDAVKPGLIDAYGELGHWDPALLGASLDTILTDLGSVQPRGLAAHWYMLGNWEGLAASDPWYPSIEHLVITGNDRNNISHLTKIVATLRDRAAAHGLGHVPLFLGEFGSSWSSTPADGAMADRLAAALFNAEAQETGRAAGFDVMEWFGVSDPISPEPWVNSMIGVEQATGTPHPRPQYYVYLIYKHLYGDETVPVPEGRQQDWSIYASRGDGKSYLLAINRTASSTVTRVVQVTTAAGQRLLRLTLAPHSLSIVAF